MTATPSRRAVLRRTTFIAAATALGSHVLAMPAQAAGPNPAALRRALRDAQRRARERTAHVSSGGRSRNGWDMEKVTDDRGHVYTRSVPGTPLNVQVRMGDVETVLVHVVRRFHYEIDELRESDVVGWRAPDNVNLALTESNQASGTAVQIRPDFYPAGITGGFFPLEELVIRDILADCEGAIRWGGDDTTPDESLFSLDAPPGDARLTRVAEKIRNWNSEPGTGAGAPVDVLSDKRRKAAESLATRQRRAA